MTIDGIDIADVDIDWYYWLLSDINHISMVLSQAFFRATKACHAVFHVIYHTVFFFFFCFFFSSFRIS